MAKIEARQREMFFSPTKRRHYASLSHCAKAEAGAMVGRKYPADSTWHWTDDERLQRVRERLARHIAEDLIRTRARDRKRNG